MSDPYSGQSISGYNSSPPPDDGSQTAANEITWAGIKDKLTDPIKTLAEAIDTELQTAFDTCFGATISTQSGTFNVVAGDQGKFFSVTGTTTVNLLAAATAGAYFPLLIANDGVGTVTIDPNGSEPINGSATLALAPKQAAIITCDGSTWRGIALVMPSFLGTIATQNANSVSITGGSVTGITDVAIADGGTGASTASGARTNLGLAIGSDVQGFDADLNAIAGTGTTSYGRGLLLLADEAAARTAIGIDAASGNIAIGDLASTITPWVRLGSVDTTSGTTASFTSMLSSTYQTYKIVFENVDASVSASSATLGIRVGVGASYAATNYQYNIEEFVASSTTPNRGNSAGGTYIPLTLRTITTALPRNAVDHLSGEIIIHNPSSTTYRKTLNARVEQYEQQNFYSSDVRAGYSSTSAITSVQLVLVGGTGTAFTNGRARLYGLRD